MRAIKQLSGVRASRTKQHGGSAVEFALVALVFFLLFFGIVEVARAMYIVNTLQEVTRRAAAFAANADFSNATSMQSVRERAIFRESPGFLFFAEPVTDSHIVIDYMWIQKTGNSMAMMPIPPGSLPASPEANFANCQGNPYSEGCIRLVRVRVCATASANDCERVGYRNLVSLVPLTFSLPASVTVVPAETLGLPAGVPPCEC